MPIKFSVKNVTGARMYLGEFGRLLPGELKHFVAETEDAFKKYGDALMVRTLGIINPSAPRPAKMIASTAPTSNLPPVQPAPVEAPKVEEVVPVAKPIVVAEPEPAPEPEPEVSPVEETEEPLDVQTAEEREAEAIMSDALNPDMVPGKKKKRGPKSKNN